MSVIERVKTRLRASEGWSSKPYMDTTGHLTIGYGTNLAAGIDKTEGEFLLEHRVQLSREALDKALPWWRDLDEVRGSVLLDMCYNMGINKLLTFKNTLRFVKAGNYKQAAENMLRSRWAKQVGKRANHLARLMEYGPENL